MAAGRTTAASSARRPTRRASSASTRRCRSGRPARSARTASSCRSTARKYQPRQQRGHGDPAAVHAARRADLDRRGVPRRHRLARLFGDGETIGRRIKAAVPDEVELTISVGVATTKLVAKIASDLRKPDGLVVVEPGDGGGVPRAAADLAGCGASGAKTAAALARVRRRTIGDLAALPDDLLVRRFGKHGASLGDRARGIDADPVGDRDAAKSVGHEHTFDVDTLRPRRSSSGRCWRWPRASPAGCATRGVKASTVTVKIRDSDVPHDHPPADAARADRPDRADLADGARARPARGARQADPAARASPRRASASASSSSLFGPTIRAGGGWSRPRTRSASGSATRAITRARLVGSRLPAPFERDPMTPVDMRTHAQDDAAPASPAPLEAGEEPDPISDDDEVPA